METLPGSEAYRQKWDEVLRASRALGQAGELMAEAHGVLDRFCSSSDQDNWDRAFAWKISELKQAMSLCREIEQHLGQCVDQAASADKA